MLWKLLNPLRQINEMGVCEHCLNESFVLLSDSCVNRFCFLLAKKKKWKDVSTIDPKDIGLKTSPIYSFSI